MPTTVPSQREIEASKWLAEGLNYKQIAYEMGVAEKTVHSHMNNLHRKIGAKTTAQTVAIMLATGYLTLPGQTPVVEELRATVSAVISESMAEIIERVVRAVATNLNSHHLSSSHA